MRYFRRTVLFLATCFLLFSMGIPIYAAGNKTIKAGEQLILSAGKSSSSYQWQVSDTTVLAFGENGKQFCKFTGLQAGTAIVTVSYSKLEWDSSKADIWGNIVGDYVVRYKTESWNVTVLPEDSAGGSDAEVKDWPDPVTHPEGIVGEHIAGTIEDSALNRKTNWDYQGLLAVKRNGLWGFADRNLNLVIPFQYDNAQDFESDHFGKVWVGNQPYYINEKGEYIVRLTPGVFYNTQAEDTVIRLTAPAGMNSGASIPTEYYNCAGQQITEEEYESAASVYSEKLAEAGGLSRYSAGDTAGTWAFTRSNGNGTATEWFLAAPDGMETSRNFREGLLVVEDSEGMKGAIDKRGNFVIDCQYLLLCDSSGGYLVGRKEGQSQKEFSVIRNPLYPSVTVRGMEAVSPGSNEDVDFSLSQLMSAATLPTASEIQIHAENMDGLTFSAPVSEDGGRTWSFILADAAGMQTTYLIEMINVIENIALDADTLTLEKGASHSLHAAVSPERITDFHLEWTSSNEQVAIVSREGVVSAMDKGKTTVTVSSMGLTASCEVTVTRQEDGKDDSETKTDDENKDTGDKKDTEKEGASQNTEKRKNKDVVTVNGITCKIISTKEKTVEYRKTSSTSTSVSIPKTVTIDNVKYKVVKIGDKAFQGKKKITKVVIGSNVKTIGKQAFSGCSGLKTVTFPSKLRAIDEKGFYQCTSLSKIVLPGEVNKIGKSAFQGDKKLKNITIRSTKLNAQNVGAKAFKGTNKKVVVKVPGKKLSAYRKLLKAKGISTKAVYRKN